MTTSLALQFDRLRARREASFDTNRSVKADKLLTFYTDLIIKATKAERCSVFIYDPEKHKIWLKAGTGLTERDIEVPVEGSIVGKVIASGSPIIQNGLEDLEGAHRLTDAKTGFVTRNLVCVPIIRPGRKEVIGAFEVLNKKEGQEFTQEDITTLEVIAEQLRKEVASVFLDQEIFGVASKVYNTARHTVSLAAGGLLVALAIMGILIFAYVLVPVIMH